MKRDMKQVLRAIHRRARQPRPARVAVEGALAGPVGSLVAGAGTFVPSAMVNLTETREVTVDPVTLRPKGTADAGPDPADVTARVVIGNKEPRLRTQRSLFGVIETGGGNKIRIMRDDVFYRAVEAANKVK